MVQSRIKALKRLETVEMLMTVRVENFNSTFLIPRLDPPILQLQNVGFTYHEKEKGDPTKYLLRAMNFNIDARLVLLLWV